MFQASKAGLAAAAVPSSSFHVSLKSCWDGRVRSWPPLQLTEDDVEYERRTKKVVCGPQVKLSRRN